MFHASLCPPGHGGYMKQVPDRLTKTGVSLRSFSQPVLGCSEGNGSSLTRPCLPLPFNPLRLTPVPASLYHRVSIFVVSARTCPLYQKKQFNLIILIQNLFKNHAIPENGRYLSIHSHNHLFLILPFTEDKFSPAITAERQNLGP